MAQSPKAKPKSDQPDKEQIERFKQTARELGCDETGEAFEKTFEKAVARRIKSQQ